MKTKITTLRFTKSFILIVTSVFVCCIFLISLPATKLYKEFVQYYDTTYFSQVFGQKRYTGSYLPNGYDTSSPALSRVYYFHGWGGRYNRDDNANLNYEKIRK
jgi:hypothetical protein